jgi:AcrR family transcriptional regulator
MSKLRKDGVESGSDVRSGLLRAATALFAEQGFGATGVQQIVDVAGVNKAMLYYYFNSKDNLYDILIRTGVELFESAVYVAERGDGGVRARLERFLTAYLSMVAENPDLARIMYREALRVGDTSRPEVADHVRDSVARLAAVFVAAQQSGDMRPGLDASLSAYSLYGIANMFISRFVVTRQALDVAPLVDHILDLFFNGAGRA